VTSAGIATAVASIFIPARLPASGVLSIARCCNARRAALAGSRLVGEFKISGHWPRHRSVAIPVVLPCPADVIAFSRNEA
jgi:hypothetical protein